MAQPTQTSPLTTTPAAEPADEPISETAVIVTMNAETDDPTGLAGRLIEIIGTVLQPHSVTVTVRGTTLRAAAPRLLPSVETPPRRRIVSLTRPVPTVLIDVPSRSVSCRGTVVELTRLEFDLLLFLCEHRDRVHRRNSLITRLWGAAQEPPGARTVDVHVRRIRAKLGDDVEVISTVRGVGYRIDDAAGVVVRRGQL
ncbi:MULTISPECIES: winged helix-turn-helix domain-containing protein [Actinoalloteichus]|uniref:Transcriptional regulatory protein n=1 Tax=Actinoalloteichus fjordicus TaxID=1612552 RepID=A0AAC9PSA9_9PSEU|nr:MULTISPECIES: winged helix-turn-helix domain-containing protein [Actinoalloteichus]APU14661.1 transcriptional regulatory protein [Actinoalloteichus fjordicus]APU20629.1 transcriptional regulatory protein [Actinoalloteichus sp. GBA129-24]